MNRVGNKVRLCRVPILSVIRGRTEVSFKSRLVRVGECLEFTGCRTKAGYGILDVTYGCKKVRYPILAHRLAWVLEHGVEIPEDRMVCHRCNNPACCDVSHLYLGTAQTNSDDKFAAGRAKKGKPLLGRRGSAHPRSLYSDEQRERAIGIHRETAASFEDIAVVIGCSSGTVSRWWSEYVAARTARILGGGKRRARISLTGFA